MELKPGYKKTDIGVIPEDWDIDKVSELATIDTGSRNTQDRVEDGAYPFFVRSPIVERIDSHSFDGEAVLTAGDGVGTGKVFHYIKGKFDFHQRVYKISDFDKERLNGYFFFLYFSNNFLKRIVTMTAKSSVDSVRKEMIADMQIPLPSITEQSAIATALSDADALTKRLEVLIVKKRNIKQGTIQQLLTGKKRLPGFGGEWITRKLEDLCVSITDGTHRTPKYVEEGIPFYSVENVVADNFKDTKSISREEHNELIRRCKPERGDILLTRIGALGTTKLINWNVEASIYVSLALLKINDQIDRRYLYWYTKTKQFMKSLEKEALLNAIPPKINLGQIGNCQISFPPTRTEQESIADIISKMDHEIEILERKLTKYRLIKQGIMQELLTGQIRLV
jgi:type I restriction enzyme S subunit